MATQIFGLVNGNGNVQNSGSNNWSSSRTSRGQYKISISGGPPAAACATAHSTEPGGAYCCTYNFETDSFSVQTHDANGDTQDNHFSFIALL